jgi:hypothetical protein
MTTRVTISNDSDKNTMDSHNIEVAAGGVKHVVIPGKFVTLHVWQGSPILITELPPIRELPGSHDGGYAPKIVPSIND